MTDRPRRSPLRVRTSPTIEAHFRRLAEETGITISNLINLAMAEYVRNHPLPPAPKVTP